MQAGVSTELQLQCEELDAIRLQVFPAVTLESAVKMRATALEQDPATVEAAPRGADRARAVLNVLKEHRVRDVPPDAAASHVPAGLVARCKGLG